MAKIHWAVYIALGAIVTAMSAYIGPHFRFFFWVGIGMVLFGMFRMLVRYMTKEPVKKEEFKPLPSNPLISRCHACRASVYTTAKFCHMCGSRLNH